MWGTVYASTLHWCDGQCTVSLKGTCQPRIEPGTVFGMKVTPPVHASLDALFDALDWVAPGHPGCRTGPSYPGRTHRGKRLGANVLDGPLLALHHFLKELRACPGAPDLQPGDVITTGPWTDAWPVAHGEQWTSAFSAPLSSLQVHSNDVSTSRFAPHGEFRIWTEGDILCYDATGPFNLEALHALAAARSSIVGQWKPKRRIAALVHWHKSALMSPEAFAAYGQGLERLHESANLPVALAWVASPDVEGMQLMIDRFEELFARRKTNFRLFDDLDAARAWVNASLAKVNDASPVYTNPGRVDST